MRTAAGRWSWGNRLVLLAILLGAASAGYWYFADKLRLETLAREELQLRAFQGRHPLQVYGLAILVYVLVTGFSLPGATVLTLVYGWFFGFLRGLVVVSFSSTAGATVSFLLCRFLFRDAIRHRFGERLANFSQALEREGPFFLFTLRLIPAVPFFMINAVMGLTPIRTRTFWWVSQLGMLPATCVYTYAGSRVPGLRELADEGLRAVFTASQLAQILVAFVLLGIFPFIVRAAMKRFTSWHARMDKPATAAESRTAPDESGTKG